MRREHLSTGWAEAGFEHYEISNWGKPGRHSRHNSSYWNQTPYIGLGAAAHSFDGRNRQWNVADIRQYMEGMEKGEPCVEHEELTPDNHYNEIVMTALRTSVGLDLTKLAPADADYCLRLAQRFILDGLLVHEQQQQWPFCQRHDHGRTDESLIFHFSLFTFTLTSASTSFRHVFNHWNHSLAEWKPKVSLAEQYTTLYAR